MRSDRVTLSCLVACLVWWLVAWDADHAHEQLVVWEKMLISLSSIVCSISSKSCAMWRVLAKDGMCLK
jgi:hypothetical protein